MKRQSRRSKSQDCTQVQANNDVLLTILLSNQDKITVPVPINCPLQIINSILSNKISQLQANQVIGFQSVPPNYSFDYKLSKNIGILTQKKNITLNCLYKLSSAQKQQNHNKNSKPNFEQQYFRKIIKYKLCKPLSSGGFSRVYLVRNLQNGQFYAAKFMQKSSQVNLDRQQAIRNEFLVHTSLNHPYIVKMQEYIETDEFYILIMQYCPGGQLFTLLKNNRYMGQQKAKVIFIQILLAIKYLHNRNIVFRDIKPQNILIDALGNAKLTDFGLAKQIRGKTNSYCGSVQYMAPQIVSKQTYSFDVDLYCMGALLYQILIGCPPFYNPNFTNNQTKYHICNSQVCFPRKVNLSDQVKDLIGSLLIKDPNERLGHQYGVQQILQHQWIGNISIPDYMNGNIQNPFLPNLDIQNFDRQQDQYELSFRNKIFKDIKKCKKLCNGPIKVIQRCSSNQDMKKKSQSLNLGSKKHIKAKSQQQLKVSIQQKKQFQSIKPKTFSNKWYFEKHNPYAFSIKNKSMSQLVHGHKDQAKIQIDQKNAFKKKKLHRTLSKSINKSSVFGINKSLFDPEINKKSSQINKILLVNSKSCNNSRKSSLYKKFVQNGNQKKNNKIQFIKIDGRSKYLKQNKDGQKWISSLHLNRSSEAKDGLLLKNQNKQQKREQIYVPQVNNEKQNQQKGLKRKNALGKKFIFATGAKEDKKIKQNYFNFQKKNIFDEQKVKNRQTVF